MRFHMHSTNGYRTCKKRFQDDKDECEERGGGGSRDTH